MHTRMRVFLVLMIAVYCFIPAVFAAEWENEVKEFRGKMYIGGTQLDLDALNERLADKGYTEFSDGLFSFGGGAFIRVSERFMLGFDGNFSAGDYVDSVIGTKSYSSSIFAGTFFVDTAFLAFTSDYCDIFPVVGIGGGGIAVKIGQNEFDDILDDPKHAAMISTGSMLLKLAVEADYKFKVSGNSEKLKFLTVGFNAGYALPIFSGGWYMNEFKLNGSPDGGISGPFVHITFGGGGGK